MGLSTYGIECRTQNVELSPMLNQWMLINLTWFTQRIQYAKTKSDVIAKADGTFVPRERRKRHDDRGNDNLTFLL